MQLRFFSRLAALEDFLDEVDAPARAVELVAEKLIRRTGREAETAMDATAQDFVGFAAVRRLPDEIGE